MPTLAREVAFNGSNGSHFFAKLQYEIFNSDIPSKKTKVRYYLKIGSYDAYSASGSACRCYINDTLIGTFSSIPAYSETQIGYLEVEYAHDANGECNANWVFSVDIYWSGLANIRYSGTLALPSIQDIPKLTTSGSRGYFKDTSWKLRKTYLKVGGAWKLVRPSYKKGSSWYN